MKFWSSHRFEETGICAAAYGFCKRDRAFPQSLTNQSLGAGLPAHSCSRRPVSQMGSPYRGSLAGTAGQQGAADLIPDNGIVERFHKTMLDEFYRVAFRKKLCATIDGLQADLDDWVGNYSEERPHQDRCLSKPEWRTRSDSRRRPSDQVPATTVKLKGLMPNQYVRHMQRPDANAGSSPVRYARHSHSLCFREIKAKMLDQQESQRRAVG
jgi:hypothetical protein